MKSGYDQFFKNARKAAAQPGLPQKNMSAKQKQTRANFQLKNEDIEETLRRKMNVAPAKTKIKKRKSFPVSIVLFAFVGLGLTAWGYKNYEKVEFLVKNIEISLLGEANAQEAAAKKTAEAKDDKKADEKKVAESAEKAVEKTGPTSDEVDHLAKLNDRKKELDAKEEELQRVEAELQKQREELDKRMKELVDMRDKISTMLQERVKSDDQKVETLVQMYSNMKPQQAAKVFESIDEDLAIEILGRMKKKNAAEIMNLIKPEKAQVFSERFAGYKRAPASTK